MAGSSVTFFEAVAACGADAPERRVTLYKQAADFLAGADVQANVGDVLADLGADWSLAASTLVADSAVPVERAESTSGTTHQRHVAHYALHLSGALLGCPPAVAACPAEVQARLLQAVLQSLQAPGSAKVGTRPTIARSQRGLGSLPTNNATPPSCPQLSACVAPSHSFIPTYPHARVLTPF
jgi:hypothetical protein